MRLAAVNLWNERLYLSVFAGITLLLGVVFVFTRAEHVPFKVLLLIGGAVVSMTVLCFGISLSRVLDEVRKCGYNRENERRVTTLSVLTFLCFSVTVIVFFVCLWWWIVMNGDASMGVGIDRPLFPRSVLLTLVVLGMLAPIFAGAAYRFSYRRCRV